MYENPRERQLPLLCSSCGDHVYEYCSIHGRLLVIPDDEVPSPTGPPPPLVPRAALSLPRAFLHLAPSTIPGAGLGVFSTLTLPAGVRFGPYRGLKTQAVTSSYCWQIFDRERKPSHVLDARDANKSNWMRYVNCSRHFSEQNLVAFQYRGQLYYRRVLD
ncbi:histone-lysine N-methyltransferase PRDM7-like [Cydia strobilella]|uniref:histone-lysine N-methyltransferase PRDM7-like n=1 Tax=Cydia strobilella TaxID=1100964 RepID=UPI00300615A7